MPYISHTPESLIPRSDSKNPATTCKGITSSGRPCRRSLAASSQNSPSSSPRSNRGVLALLPDVDHEHDTAAVYYCWQHKDQAQNLVDQGSNQNSTRIVGLKHTSSIDTLVDRLGVLDVQESPVATSANPQRGSRPIRREILPQKWQQVPGPLMTVSEDRIPVNSMPRRKQPHHRKPTAETDSIWSFLCCSSDSVDSEYVQVPRIRHTITSSPQPNMVQGDAISGRDPRLIAKMPASTASRPSAHARPMSQQPQRRAAANVIDEQGHRPVRESAPPNYPTRPSLPHEPSSQTQDLLSLIPKNLSPQTTSLLLAELAKPISPFDQDGGWIYIFWLTSSSASATPDTSLASSLLAPPTRPNVHARRTSDLIRDFSSSSVDNNIPGSKKTILLKIGRASNVQRRLNEWSRQCNHNLSLIRYYPYHPSSSSSSSSPPFSSSPPSTPPHSSSSPPPHKVPHAHRVERLIHIELANQRVKHVCDGCGKEHREWFEVEGTREGVRGVDEVVRRWVRWAEGLAES
ncbi:hypothetical protein MMC14_003526 [Varicellaria rhodocarpa]|nr:hypothetical protein [Varicellaria rhodocarpa]